MAMLNYYLHQHPAISDEDRFYVNNRKRAAEFGR